jgi:hypothetical protein
MRRYGACLVALAAFMLVGSTAVAAAHTNAKQSKSFIVVGRHNQRVSLYVQRGHHSASARAASCPAGGPYGPSYCSPPVEQNLFGAYAWGSGSVTFGSGSSSTCRALGWSSGPCGVYTTQANTLIVAFVGSSGSSVTVSCRMEDGGTCPVTFKKVRSENAGGGDSEVWYADATNVIPQKMPMYVTATSSRGTDVSLQAVTFTNAITAGAGGAQATGIGASNACFSLSGAPSCSVTTTESDSQVWASLNNPRDETVPTWPSNQFAIGVSDSANEQTFYSQFLGTCKANKDGSKPCTTMPLPSNGLYQNPYQIAPTAVSPAGIATINDTSPTNNPFNEVVVEIL